MLVVLEKGAYSGSNSRMVVGLGRTNELGSSIIKVY